MALVKQDEVDEEYSIKPEQVTPSLDTSNWPLLLKNYDKRMDGSNPRTPRPPQPRSVETSAHGSPCR